MADDVIQHIAEIPDLREPVFVAAFGGWNDAGDAATYAAETLQTAWSAIHFAEIDPENFFDFTQTRPEVSLGPTGQRSLVIERAGSEGDPTGRTGRARWACGGSTRSSSGSSGGTSTRRGPSCPAAGSVSRAGAAS